MENKTVSIIMPIYNAEKYLEQGIQSILKQTYKQLEIILVDDGSTDTSREIIEAAEQKDSRISSIFQAQQGAPTARNAGCKISVGEYLYFMDSDDYLPETAIEKMVSASLRYGSDLVIGQYQFINEAGKWIGESSFIEELEISLYGKATKHQLSLCPPFPGNKLYRASIIKGNGIQFADVKVAQDLNFYLKALLFAANPIVVKDSVYYYRVRSGSISHSYGSKMLDVITSLEEPEMFHRQNGQYDRSFFSNIKFLHYYYQLIKVPQIQNYLERTETFLSFKKEFAKIQKADLTKELIDAFYYKSKLKLRFRRLYTGYLNSKRQKRKMGV